MDIEGSETPVALLVGLGATLVLDLWDLFLKRAFGIPSLDYCLLGRWLRHMPGSRFRHAKITAAPHKPLECAAGWIAHYTIGVTLALGFGVAGSRTPRPAHARLKCLATHTVFGVGLYLCALGLSSVLRAPS